MKKLKIEYMELSKIKPYENNAKKHTKKQIEEIKTSIEQFGFNDPIAIDENGTIIERTWQIRGTKRVRVERSTSDKAGTHDRRTEKGIHNSP